MGLEEQNEKLEKNEIDLNETIDLLKQNIKEQLNMHNIELSNKNDKLIKITSEFDEFKIEYENMKNKCVHEIEDLKNSIIEKEDEIDIHKRKLTDQEFSIKTLEEQNEKLEKNEVDLNETVDLLKQNIKEQLNMHNIEL